jgi:hypothetical protein
MEKYRDFASWSRTAQHSPSSGREKMPAAPDGSQLPSGAAKSIIFAVGFFFSRKNRELRLQRNQDEHEG